MGLAWSETGALWGKEGANLQDNRPERKKDEADTAIVKTPLRKTALGTKGKASKNKDTAQGAPSVWMRRKRREGSAGVC